MSADVPLVWHYTSGDCLECILADGEIRVAEGNIEARERPAVWFTTRQTFEPTAVKCISKNGRLGVATPEEMDLLAGGHARIGVAARLVRLGWTYHVNRSGISRRTARALATYGEEIGSEPNEWRVFYGCVPSGMWSRVQVMRDGQWIDRHRVAA